MHQISFNAFALQAHQSSRGGVNPNLAGGPSGAGGPSVCAVELRDSSLFWHGTYAGEMKPGFYEAFADYVNPMDAPCRLPYGATWADGPRAYGGVPRDWLQ